MQKEISFERLREIIAEVLHLNPREILPDSRFTEDLGADSLDLVEIVMRLEEIIGKEIPEEEARKVKTVQEAIDLLRKHGVEVK